MTIQATASPPTRMDGLSMLEATHQFSSATILGRTITLAQGITRRLAAAIREALAADTSEASAVGTVAGIAERECSNSKSFNDYQIVREFEFVLLRLLR
jgi:hypothetical protein